MHAAGDIEVLQHGELLEDGGALKGAPHPHAHDLVRLQREEVLVAVAGVPGALDQAGERVDEGGLAGAVGADEEVQLSLEERDVHPVDGLEPVKVDGQALDLEVVESLLVGSGHAVAFRFAVEVVAGRIAQSRGTTEDRPAGISRITTMNSAPWK